MRAELEALEQSGDDPHVPLVWLCIPALPIPPEELNAARRRAMFVLAAGGDPYRDLDLDSVAAERLAAELDSPERRTALAAALAGLDVDGLPGVAAAAAALHGDPELAWRCLGVALLADELTED